MQCCSTWLIVLLSRKVRISQMFSKIQRNILYSSLFFMQNAFLKKYQLRLFFPTSAFSKLFVCVRIVTVKYVSASKLPTRQVISFSMNLCQVSCSTKKQTRGYIFFKKHTDYEIFQNLSILQFMYHTLCTYVSQKEHQVLSQSQM